MSRMNYRKAIDVLELMAKTPEQWEAVHLAVDAMQDVSQAREAVFADGREMATLGDLREAIVKVRRGKRVRSV